MKKILLSFIMMISLGYAESISEIQGRGLQSPLLDRRVSNVEGIITYKVNDRYNKGMYIQSEKPDQDPNTSEGIYVEYKGVDKISVGDLVVVSGKVGEKQFARFDKTKLTVTTIFANKLEVIDVNLKPMITDIYGDEIPVNVSDDNVLTIDRTASAMDFYESLEGMVVRIKNPYITGHKEEYGDVFVIPKLARDKAVLTENGGVLYDKYGNEKNHVLNVSATRSKYWKNNHFIREFTPNPGDRFKGDIIGVLTNDNYNDIKILPIEELPPIENIGAKPDVLEFDYREDMINIASYNVENYAHVVSPERTVQFAKQVKDKLNTPDIITLIEVGDDDGPTTSDVVSSEKNGQALIDAIRDETNIEYGYLAVDPEYGKDGGMPSMNIRNAILYRKDRVKLIESNKSTSYDNTKVILDNNGKAKLKYNPGRIGLDSEYFVATRKPLVALFDVNGKHLYIIGVHLSSKRGDDPIYGPQQPPIRRSEVNRNKQATYINNFVKEILSKDKDASIVVMGDINDYDFSTTSKNIRGNELIDVMGELAPNKRYSYVYGGMSQVLDNMFINKEYSGKVNVDVIRINPEFTKAQGAFSDHDPVFIQFKIK
ncbi:endonuclease/exonuclease/phosphatase family protein [Streptobacillus moniliformis]|uniref:endonuclease/exonuclease/phosphatase family protein n=1 Tax=Streptobacillus moniliformis TaxID=34105 RepID=UPI0007E41489|nr:endonuclease/exonuclease/phosphatase family protein [Streptobacillus moniliformis]